MTFLTTVPAHLGNGHTVNPNCFERVLHFFKLERLDNSLDFLHGEFLYTLHDFGGNRKHRTGSKKSGAERIDHFECSESPIMLHIFAVEDATIGFYGGGKNEGIVPGHLIL